VRLDNRFANRSQYQRERRKQKDAGIISEEKKRGCNHEVEQSSKRKDRVGTNDGSGEVWYEGWAGP